MPAGGAGRYQGTTASLPAKANAMISVLHYKQVGDLNVVGYLGGYIYVLYLLLILLLL
jgi:hypothetical protein